MFVNSEYCNSKNVIFNSQTCPYGPFHNKETSLSWTLAVLLAPKTYRRTALFPVLFRVGVHTKGAWMYWLLTYSYYNHPSADPCLLCMPLVTTTSVLMVTTLTFNLSRGKRSFKPYTRMSMIQSNEGKI